MNLSIENILLIGSLLLLISIIAGKASFRFGVPVLVLFLGIGMLAGSEGIGGIFFTDMQVAQFIGIVSLNFILFSGGLDTDWKSVKPVLWIGVSLSTLGVLLTAVSLGLFVYWLTDFSLLEGLLLGAIVSSTDAAAVFSILRSKNLALKSNLRPTLELESGSNDPMAYVLTIAFLTLILNPEMSAWSIVPLFLQQMILGGLLGFFFGWLSRIVINKISLDYEGLYPVLVIAVMFIVFSTTDYIGGNGFLAVYITAVYLGNHELIHKKTIIKAFDGFAWLMQIVLFVTLGLLVFPSHILPVIGVGILIAIFLMFVARPISVFISLLPFRMKLRRRFYISWVGLRGAVPIVFATYPLLAGIDKADMIFNLVFFISLISVLVQGSTISLFAKWFHVALPFKIKKKSAVDMFMSEHAKNQMVEIEIPTDSFSVGKKIVDLNFPKNSRIALINRKETFLTPQGSTTIESDDRLIVLLENQRGLSEVYKSLGLNLNANV
jgi:cell volume regulation protein A